MFEIVNCTNSDGFTPLHLAASEGHAPLIEILMKFGAQVEARTNNFRTPLHIACLRGNLTVIQALVQHGADINAKDIDGNTPCHFTSEYGHRYCLKFLLTRSPYLFANNNDEKSAIDVAINNDILTEFQEFITQSKDPKSDKSKSTQASTTDKGQSPRPPQEMSSRYGNTDSKTSQRDEAGKTSSSIGTSSRVAGKNSALS
jgi:ankyrin repeat protein